MAAALAPSAILIRACISPSDCAMSARFSRSARICFSIACMTPEGGVMSRISYRSTLMPHGAVAASSAEMTS